MEHRERSSRKSARDPGTNQPPQTYQAPQAQTGKGAVPYGGAPRHRTILVAENEATNRHLMEQILRIAGYDTLSATNGREALSMLETSHADLILVDISMPVLDGYATLALLREQPAYATTPVVAVTAHATIEDRQRALRSGFTEYLTKPFRPRDLLRLVERLLAHGEPS
jgi:CheY-like chemotaxis protein